MQGGKAVAPRHPRRVRRLGCRPPPATRARTGVTVPRRQPLACTHAGSAPRLARPPAPAALALARGPAGRPTPRANWMHATQDRASVQVGRLSSLLATKFHDGDVKRIDDLMIGSEKGVGRTIRLLLSE